jgi:hypothetical protein
LRGPDLNPTIREPLFQHEGEEAAEHVIAANGRVEFVKGPPRREQCFGYKHLWTVKQTFRTAWECLDQRGRAA